MPNTDNTITVYCPRGCNITQASPENPTDECGSCGAIMTAEAITQHSDSLEQSMPECDEEGRYQWTESTLRAYLSKTYYNARLSPTFKAHLFDMDYNLIAIVSLNYGQQLVTLVDAKDGEPFTDCSINVAGVQLEQGEFILKTYSENSGVMEALLEAKLIALTGRGVQLPFNVVPIVKLLF